MLCSRTISAARFPLSCSFKILIICSSVNLVFMSITSLFLLYHFVTNIPIGLVFGVQVTFETVLIAPSAVNKQPWRIIQTENAYHFYKTKAPKSSRASLDIQRVDIGIAACHFHLAALEKNLPGRFEKLPAPDISTPEHEQYIFSWVM